MTDKNLKLNFIMNAILKMAYVLFPLITFPYISRVLQPEGVGKVNLAVSVIEYFNMFAQLGIPTYGIKACARVRDNREELTRTVHELLFLNLIVGAVSYIILLIALCSVPRLVAEKTLYLITSASIFLSAIGVEWLYQALEEYSYITIRSVICKAIAVVAMFMMVHEPSDYQKYAAITIFGTGASYLLNFLNLKKYVNLRPVGGYDFRRHWKPVFIFFALACTTTIYTNLDNVMLGFMKTDVDVGYYSTSVKIKNILVSLITSLGAVLLPRASYYVEQGLLEDFKAVTRKALHFVVLVSVPVTIYFILFAKESIMFIAGPAYEGSVLPMQVIMPTLFLIGLTNILGMEILVPTGREKQVLYSTIVGAVVDIVINALLIPVYGATGAAIGTVAAEFSVLLVQVAFLRGEILDIVRLVPFVRIAGSTGLAGVTAVLLRNASLKPVIVLLVTAVPFFGIYGILNVEDILVFLIGKNGKESSIMYRLQSSYLMGILRSLKKNFFWVLLVTFLGAAALAGFGYLKVRNTNNLIAQSAEKNAEYEQMVADYEKAIADTEEALKLCEDQVRDLQEYVDNSIYMNLDGENVHVASIIFTVNPAAEDVNVGNILQAMNQYVTQGSIREALPPEDADLKVEYWGEVIGTTINGNNYSIFIMQPTEDQAVRSMKIIQKRMYDYVAGVKDTMGPVTMTDEGIVPSSRSDAGIVNAQNNNRNNLRNFTINHSDYESRLNSQRGTLQSFIEKNKPDAYGAELASAKKEMVKYGIIGAVLGLIAGCVLVLIDFVMGEKLRSYRDISKYGIKVLGRYYRKKGCYPEAARVCMDIKLLLDISGKGSVSLYSFRKNERSEKAAGEYMEELRKCDISSEYVSDASESAESLRKLIANHSMVLVVEAGVTLYREIEETISMCRQYGVDLIGCIVLC